ncbi:MAG: Na+-dependent transporter [Afipia sp.]|nr:Na+-dependent transporter [Afipia sp.]
MSASRQQSLALPVAVLAWLGRQGTRAIAALVFIGIAIPPLGTVLRPYLTEAVFVLLVVSFMRVDVAAMRGYLARPALVIGATLWSTIAVPLLFGLGGLASGLDKSSPDLFLGLMLQAVASPMMASPALVALMGLDSTLVLITLVTSTALVPLTAPLFAYLFFGSALTLSPLALGLKLFAMLAGAIVVAAVIRRLAGADAIARHRQPIDGFNILVLLVFVSAVMGTVAASFWAEPIRVLLLTVFAFVVFAGLLGVTALVFRKAGPERALALGLMASQRNMGLMLAGTDGALPGLTWLYFALAQFPIYVSPQLLKPLVRSLRRASTPAP